MQRLRKQHYIPAFLEQNELEPIIEAKNEIRKRKIRDWQTEIFQISIWIHCGTVCYIPVGNIYIYTGSLRTTARARDRIVARFISLPHARAQ